MSGHNCLGQTVQENNVGNWKPAGNSVRCQDVINARGRNQSSCYSAPLLQEVLGQLWSLQLAGVLFQTHTQSKRFVWGAVLTRRKKHSPFSYLNFFSFYAFSRGLPNNCSSWFFLRAQRSLSLNWWAELHQMAGAVPAGAADSEQSCLGSEGYGKLCLWVLYFLFWDLTWKGWDTVCVETSGWMTA